MTSSILQQGWSAIEELSFEKARTSFEAAIATEESPEAYEGLATAAYGLDDAKTAIDSYETAFRLYQKKRDSEGATRAATSLAEAILDFRGDAVVASGWIKRARSLADDTKSPLSLARAEAGEAYMALAFEKDPVKARGIAEPLLTRVKALGDPDSEMALTALLGLIEVSRGETALGMALLDQATTAALSGELSQLRSLEVCCFLVTACVRVRDFDRAAQWSRHVIDRSSDPIMLSVPRIELATVYTWWGRWKEAEEILLSVISEMESRPVMAGLAMVRLADLKRRQGRLDEAEALLRRAESPPYRSGIAHALLSGKAHLRLAQGDIDTALELGTYYLESVPEEDIIERVDVLELIVRASIRRGDVDRAQTASDELGVISQRIGVDAVEASARLARGLVSGSVGETTDAIAHLERSVDRFDAAGAPYESAIARLELARLLIDGEKRAVAQDVARQAADTLSNLGASEAATAERILADLGSKATVRRVPLTRREIEVLRLVCRGLSNEEIAAELVLSLRTVERHLSNIYTKIGAFGRAARAVATAYAFTHDLV